jgi:hypothetical protein
MQPGKGLAALNIIHKAMLIGQFILAAVIFYMIYSNQLQPSMTEQERMLQVIAIALCAAGFFGGANIFRRKLQEIRTMQGGAKERFAAYRTACIVQWALLEGPCIFSIIGFFLTGNYAFMALAGMFIILFVLQSPTKNKVMQHLELSEQEIGEL